MTYNSLPELPVVERLEWVTDVQVALDGTEQRTSLRRTPKLNLELNYQLVRQAEVDAYLSQLIFDSSGEVILPLYQYATSLHYAALPNDTTIYFNAARTDVRAGEYLYICNPSSGTNEVHQVNSIFPGLTSVEIDEGLLYDYPAGSVVCPALPFWLEDRNKLNRHRLNSQAKLSISASSVAARGLKSWSIGSEEWPTLNGFNILWRQPSAERNFDLDIDHIYHRLDFGIGTVQQFSYLDMARTATRSTWTIQRVLEPQQMVWWQDFLDQTCGRQKAFLAPTWRGDFRLLYPLGPGYIMDGDSLPSLVLAGSDYRTKWWPEDTYRRLAIRTAGGVVYVKVDSVEDYLGNTKCWLEVPRSYPEDTARRTVTSIDLLPKVRLDSDIVTLSHGATETSVDLTLRTVP